MKVTIIGLGEAGPVFAQQLAQQGMMVTAWDKLQDDESTADQQIEKTRALGLEPGSSGIESVSQADLIISTVTASQALTAAQEVVTGLNKGCQWLDLNSVSPTTKQAIRNVVTAKGVLFTEGVAMDTVPSKGIAVPILLCGDHSTPLSKILNDSGFNTRSISEEFGAASSTKLLRSILMKGMESLFAESMEAAAKVGVQNEVIASMQATYPELNWEQVAGYQLSRATIHAKRRAEEMREAEALVEQLGINPLMTAAIAKRQQSLSDRGLASHYSCGAEPSTEDFIQALDKAGC